MLPDRLQDAEGPAEALAHQSLGVDGCFGEGQRAVLVDDLQLLFQQSHGEVGVLCDGVDGIAANRLHGAGDDAAWLGDVTDLPDIQPLLIRRDPRGHDWISLESHAGWERRSDRPKIGMTEDRRELWIRTQSYLIHDRDEPRVSMWASSHNWMGLRMPMPGEWHDGYLGTYPDIQPWPDEFAVHFDEEGASPDGWAKTKGLGPRLKVTVAHYALDRERDFSNDEAAGRAHDCLAQPGDGGWHGHVRRLPGGSGWPDAVRLRGRS